MNGHRYDRSRGCRFDFDSFHAELSRASGHNVVLSRPQARLGLPMVLRCAMNRLFDSLPKAKILLVDDRLPNLVALKAILEGLDLDLIEVQSGDDALSLLLEIEFAAVLLDVQMPGMDGFE